MINDEEKWDLRFLGLAQQISTFSKDPSTVVGSVITDRNHRLISSGYNGFPKGIKDIDERYSDRNLKYLLIIHAEMNSIIFAERNLEDCIIYTTPFPPCSNCAGAIINSGIKRVVSFDNDLENPRWKNGFELSAMMYKEAGVTLDLYHR